MDTNENVIEKLKYIGLDLNNIPDFLTTFEALNYQPVRNYSEKNYKVYKYVDIKDIEIFITPTNRLTDISKRYAKAVPLCAYLDPKNQDDIEKHTQFLKMLDKLDLHDIETLEKQQEVSRDQIPYKIKYAKDYLWQIYYSENTDRYFMLVPLGDEEYSALFYILKKQLEGKSEKIYVPICYSNYSNEYLYSSEIADIENELWYFTKEWPEVYETYDKEGNMLLNIVGNIYVYNTIMSYYKIVLSSKKEASEFYKLLKAMFILQTEVSHYYKFNIKLDKTGNIVFYEGRRKITFENLKEYIKEKYMLTIEKNVKKTEERIVLEKEIESLKEVSKKLDLEYIEKEKQISTFLECKKTFMGKIKYFFKYKKKKTPIDGVQEIKQANKQTIKYCERQETKELYTLEELLEISKKFIKEENLVKNLELDYKALKSRVDMMNQKIENASLYIQEIDKHKKSIFEFWKFTNTEGMQQLSAGIEKNNQVRKLKKSFDIETDFEEIAKLIDSTQRSRFTKEELESIYIATTNQLEDLNLALNGKDIPENNLEILKKELKEQNTTSSFDIFGSILDSSKQIKTLGNEKHREVERNKFSILRISQDTTLDEYIDKMKNIVENIKGVLEKINFNMELPVYKASETIEKGLSIFHINAENVIKDTQSNEFNLYKLNLKENTKCIGLTNIIYYDNYNKTLPLGMNLSDGILVNLELQFTKLDSEYIITDDRMQGSVKFIKLNIFEAEM